MTTEEAIEAIRQINSMNGFAFAPSVITDMPTQRVRGVYVTRLAGGMFCCDVNADGICLQEIQQAITEKLGDGVVFDALVVDNEPNEGGDDDATFET